MEQAQWLGRTVLETETWLMPAAMQVDANRRILSDVTLGRQICDPSGSDMATIHRALSAAQRAARWVEGKYVLWAALNVNVELEVGLRQRRELHGVFCGEWLPYSAIRNGTWLHRADETAGSFPRAVGNTSAHLLADVGGWMWEARGVMLFEHKVRTPRESCSAPTRGLSGDYVGAHPHLLRTAQQTAQPGQHASVCTHCRVVPRLAHSAARQANYSGYDCASGEHTRRRRVEY